MNAEQRFKTIEALDVLKKEIGEWDLCPVNEYIR
jgi:hypothetical protein